MNLLRGGGKVAPACHECVLNRLRGELGSNLDSDRYLSATCAGSQIKSYAGLWSLVS